MVPRYRRRFGVVFQDHRLLFDRSVHDNVALPLVMAGFSPTDTARRVRAALDKVGLLFHEQANPAVLSGGEQQRVAIARAFAREPAVLFADEPTGNLDTRTGERIIDLLFELNARASTTLVLVTHDERLAERCDQRFSMSAGELSGP